jgi:hypothetical protein
VQLYKQNSTGLLYDVITYSTIKGVSAADCIPVNHKTPIKPDEVDIFWRNRTLTFEQDFTFIRRT